jgi:hypothetical protein
MPMNQRGPAGANGGASMKMPTSVRSGEAKPKANGSGSQAPLLSAEARECGKDLRETYNKTVSGIIDFGRKLTAAKKRFPGEFTDIVHRYLPIGLRTAERYMKIAEHKVLSDPTHVSSLPPSYGTLDVLTRIPADQMLMMLQDGSVHCEMERKAAERLVERIYEDGLYFFRDFQNALNTISVIKQQWLDTNALAEKLSKAGSQPGEEAIFLHWEDSANSGDWLIKFHAACERLQRQLDRKWEQEVERSEHEEKRAREAARKAAAEQPAKRIPKNPRYRGGHA